jgi:hypothetical protein
MLQKYVQKRQSERFVLLHVKEITSISADASVKGGGWGAFSPGWVVPSSALKFIQEISVGSFGSVLVGYCGVRIAAKI